MSYVFDRWNYLKFINLGYINTSSVITMKGLFKDCFNLTSIDISNFDTSNVTDISSMFQGC